MSASCFLGFWGLESSSVISTSRRAVDDFYWSFSEVPGVT